MTISTTAKSTVHKNYAARLPAGTENPVTLSKNGVYHTQRMPDGRNREIMACGLACSECFSGARLYKVLKSGFEYEEMVMDKLAINAAAPPLSIHTSNGVPTALGPFLDALSIHLPWKNLDDDWCVSLQIEGASAVWAAIDMLLQVNVLEGGDPKRIKVAVGATSYHGPPSTSFGSKTAIWPKEQQCLYPVPMADGSYQEHELLQKYETFLDTYGDQVGVILFEPQWGSSQAALPWPQHLLKTYITMAKERGIKVICDEIMCGLGRHGQGTLFLSQAWDLDPDAITFGKAIATGAYQLSGAVLKTGRTLLESHNCTVLQSHTYAGSCTRALMAATEVLKEIVDWLPHVAHRGDEMAQIMTRLNQISNGMMICHGQGLMWGGIIAKTGRCSDAAYRTTVVTAFRENCNAALILPYLVPIGGFMITPVIDIDAETVTELGARLERAVVRTMQQVAWPAAPAATPVVAFEMTNSKNDPSLTTAAHMARATLANEQEEAKLILSETVA
jgi:adenosylmethionine-8-amino-7-oxononanoate aminotransferase